MATMKTLATMALLAMTTEASAAELPPAIAAQGETVVLHVHAVGAQLYDCKADANGRLVWHFREPIASLFEDGRTVGRHYAGPSWEVGGSVITGKVAAQAPGAGPKDVAWLKLDVADHRGEGPLKDVTTVQRINTAGGKEDGACERAGDIHAEPYAADYVFLKK
ncbi:MAG TPA: DUF3455 domain-containing protein [Roseiarcus sp.]|jgi:hypothetical protein